ncbi:MAG TPA: hypothetical protein VMF69_13550 [Gemmataceae bacterium]|nr:hypothetical protein [Gemmataceae bacterium]
MKPLSRLTAMIVLVLIVSRIAASEMGDELLVNASARNLLRTRFATYGYWPRQAVFLEAAGFRLRLPDGVAGVTQTGLYSLFALSGDCEATLTYELLDVAPPQGGYGSGVGLAFDLGEGDGRGTIQRVYRKDQGSGYVLQTVPGESKGNMREVDRFVPTVSRRGRIGLRRIKKELIFLHADAPADPLQEVDRLSFTDRTIRTVRVFADPGGSPTAVDVRVSQIEIRAEEIAAGVPQREQRGWGWSWLWAVVPVVSGVLVFWFRRTVRPRCAASQTCVPTRSLGTRR